MTTVIVFAPGPMVRLGGNIWEGTVPTLRAEAKRGDAEPHILVIDGTRVDDVRVYDDNMTPCLKNRMGTGGNNVPFVAIPIQDGREMEKKQNGLGIGQENDPSYTLDQTGAQAVAQTTTLGETMQVRRLTPVECERLMGWPDNHTLHRADGKTNSDTTRYKMCGNGVASPVAQWIAEQINLAENGL
jgi:site-specific DNA-cytosine methylase